MKGWGFFGALLMKKLLLTILFISWVHGANAAAQQTSDTTELYRDLELFTKALYHVQKDYAETPDNKKLIYGALHGMMASLDPHSMFLPAEAYKELRVDTQGWFGGIGIEITVKDNFLTVVSPMEGSPAARAGIHSGDRILKINGAPVKGLGLYETVQKMRGPRGSKMTLTIVSPPSGKSREITLERGIIHIKSVRSELPEPGYGYVKINSFQEGTTEELEKSMKALEKKSGGKLQGLVLDLRNNPGGLLEEAVAMADKFLEQGVIVSTSSRGKEIDRREAHAERTDPHYPIVVLVNEGSASAAEIVAAALQDNKRAVLIGSKTFGKGSVQTIFELGRDAAIKLTVAKYFTPKGRSIHGQGIAPNIVVTKKPSPETAPSGKTLPDEHLKLALDYLKKKQAD